MATNGFLTTTATTPTPTGSRRNSNSGNPHTAPYGTANKSSRNGNIVVFSGGSAANSLVDVFESLRAANSKDTTLSYVVPISDNGGSSSELIRVFGGPGIGDIRSRLVRLIPSTSFESQTTDRQTTTAQVEVPTESEIETSAIKTFFNHRLAPTYAQAREEWHDILETQHALWRGISSPKRELIRSFLTALNSEMLKRLRPGNRFDFSGASVGNLFLTGARLFTGSFESAIYLLSSICALPPTTAVLPALNTNFACHIAAGLEDGTVITGQNEISHPSVATAAVPVAISPTTADHQSISNASPIQDPTLVTAIEDANLPGTLPILRRPHLRVSKHDEPPLPARIDRVWYINPYGAEIHHPASPRVLAALASASCVIYSIGSLFTSLVPSLILGGVGNAIADPGIKTKILILNGFLDRETGPPAKPFKALDYVAAVAKACSPSPSPLSATISPHPATGDDTGGRAAVPEMEYSRYITHLIYLDHALAPAVDKREFARLGIETLRVYGLGGRYDSKALGQALEAVAGRRKGGVGGERSRRNTLVG